jgi:hypothetical protein
VGVALAPDLALENLHPGVLARPVALHPLKRRIYVAFRAGGRSAAIDAMLDVLRETVASRGALPAEAAEA